MTCVGYEWFPKLDNGEGEKSAIFQNAKCWQSRKGEATLYASVLLMCSMLFKVYVRLEQMNREITQIVRTVALRETGLDRREAGTTEGIVSKVSERRSRPQ